MRMTVVVGLSKSRVRVRVLGLSSYDRCAAVPLQQAVSEQYKDDLIDDQIEERDENASRSEKHFSWRCRSSMVVRNA